MMLVLTTLSLEQGKPEDNAVPCSAHALLRMLGWTDGSHNDRSWELGGLIDGPRCRA
ncbi:hypothetical protein [Deinococcus sonorensis]|uniref:Transposase n=2 Tax=Deinococcus sonorensis TaxID=309891 RepID=A0AAU7U6B2_9DEIO